MKTIITAALTGVWPTKKDNPAVPYTPEEIAQDVFACSKAGAAIVHLHMRDENGEGTMDVARFRKTVELIRANKDVDVVINLSTSGDAKSTDETRQLHLKELKPDIASYDCGTMNWMHKGVFFNTPPFLEELGKTLIEHNIKPEIEIFDCGMVYNAIYYQKKGVLKAPMFFQFALGVQGGMDATVENLVFLKNLLPEGSVWGAFGIAGAHLPIMFAALALGGHVRVGLEDNVMFSKGQLAESNAQLVTRAADCIKLFGNEVANADDARRILGLTKQL